MAYAAAVKDRTVERIGRRDRDAGLFGGLDDVVVGASLRRRHDDAVDGRVLNDLVQDFDLAGGIIHRRFRTEQQDPGADHVAGDSRADIDRVKESIACRVRHDREGQMPVGRMEILRAGGLFCGLLEIVAANRFLDAARLREECEMPSDNAAAEAAYNNIRFMIGPPLKPGTKAVRAQIIENGARRHPPIF